MGLVGLRFGEAAGLFVKGDSFGLKSVSEDLSVDALIHDDGLLAEASVACYALGKMMEKRYITSSPGWPGFKKKIVALLKKAVEQGDHEAVHKVIGEIEAISKSFGRFVIGSIDKGRLKAAANMYAHGASLGKAVELSGANKTEVSAYIGMTRIPDKYETIPLKERLGVARKLL